MIQTSPLGTNLSYGWPYPEFYPKSDFLKFSAFFLANNDGLSSD